jgi:hypothetical protein
MYGIHRHPEHVEFETKYPQHEQSRNHYTYDRPEPPGNIRFGYINGINTDFQKFEYTLYYFSDMSGGYAFHGIHNASQGKWGDIKKCRMGLNGSKCTEPVRLLHQEWDSFLKGNTPDARYLMFAHSGGSIHLMLALLTYDPERRKQIHCVCIAPGGYVYQDTCASVIHYRVSRFHDMVPYFDGEGSARSEQQGIVQTISSTKGGFQDDHDIIGRTYRPKIREHIQDFLLK